MQGRTNVKDGIALNATISEKEIESGSITAGDFVEYKTISQVESFLPTTVYNDYLDLGNNKYIIGAGQYIYLVELANGAFNTLHSLGLNSYVSTLKMCKYDSEYFFVGFRTGTGAGYKLDVIKITNNQLSIYNSLDVNKIVYTGLHYDTTTRKLLLISSNQSGFVSVNSNMELQQPTWVNNPTNLTYWGVNSYWKGNILIASATNASSNNTYLRKIIVDYTNETLTLDITLDSKTWDVMTGYLIGDYLVLAGSTTTGSSQYRTMYSININTMAVSEYYSLWGNLKASWGTTDGIYFIATTGHSASKLWLHMYMLDIETGIISRVVESALVNTVPNTLIIGKDNVLYCIHQDIGYLTYSSGHDDVSDKEDKNYVKAYTGSKAIGVAKQSGTAGETIEVYIPQV